MAKFESKPKMAIFGQAASYIRSESNYCQNWQYLDMLPLKKGANQIIAKNGKIRVKLQAAFYIRSESNYCQ